jgi:hypothetical protein
MGSIRNLVEKLRIVKVLVQRSAVWGIIIDMGTLNRPLNPMYPTCDVM